MESVFVCEEGDGHLQYSTFIWVFTQEIDGSRSHKANDDVIEASR